MAYLCVSRTQTEQVLVYTGRQVTDVSKNRIGKF